MMKTSSPLTRLIDTKEKRANMESDERLLAQLAKNLFLEVDSAEIFRSERQRCYPAFVANEIVTGKVLGTGSIGVVREIIEFKQLHPLQVDEKIRKKLPVDVASHCLNYPSMDPSHNDVYSAKYNMQYRCLRNGEARYAVKSLLAEDWTDDEIIRARFDLATEIEFLRSLNHPNIIRLRGVKSTSNPLMDTTNFFIMDRLFGTLRDKLNGYYKMKQRKAKLCFVAPSFTKKMLGDLWVERLVIAYDIHAALEYIHSCKLIYRDLKSTNIGFDVKGDVKLFDFGLAKALSPNDLVQDSEGLYRLTGMTGSFPYMAPEVALEEPYNEKCDVFSFGILLWEILSLDKVSFLSGTKKTKRHYFEMIVVDGVRPKLPKLWSSSIKDLCKACWDRNLHVRPTMEDIGTRLRLEIELTEHNPLLVTNLSNRSWDLLDKSSQSCVIQSLQRKIMDTFLLDPPDIKIDGEALLDITR